MLFRSFAIFATFAASLVLTGCGQPAPLYVDQAWVRVNPNGTGPSAGYFVIHGGEEDVQLRRVTTDGALRVEMHESVMKDGMMTMQPIDQVEVPAKSKVAFAPGGKHVMIFGINPAVVKAGEMQMTLLFSNGDRLIVDAVIRNPANNDAAAGGMANMSGNMADHAH